LGGSRGIGKGMAERLAREGYNLTLVARTSHDLNLVAVGCRALGARVLTLALDITNSSLLEQAVEHTVTTFGSIDVLICAVGYNTFAPVDTLPLEEIDRLLNVNLRAPMHATRLCMPHMGIKFKRGAIIYLSSTMVGQLGYPGFAGYSTTKTALNGFAKSVFEEIRGRGVKVSTIYPAMVNSGMGNQINEEFGPYHEIAPEEMLQVSDVVDGIMFVINAGDTCCTCELTLHPQKQYVRELTRFTDTRPFPIPEPAIDQNKRVALITGASKGIGRYIASRLAQQGYDLALVARGVKDLEIAAEECRKFGVRVVVLPTDLTNSEALEKMVKSCVSELGNINILINNAGINRRRSTLSASGDVWDNIIDTNFRAAIQTTRAAVPYIAQNQSGPKAVIYISSSVVLQPGLAGVAPYYATKHAVNGFVGGLYEDIRHTGVKVSTICPGLVNTELGTKKGPVENLPAHLLIQCSDCADAVDYVLNSSPTCCPLSMMIHPQAGVAISIINMRKRLAEKFSSSKL